MAIDRIGGSEYFSRMSYTSSVTPKALRKLVAEIGKRMRVAGKLADDMERLKVPNVKALHGIAAGRSPRLLDAFLSDVRKKLDEKRP